MENVQVMNFDGRNLYVPAMIAALRLNRTDGEPLLYFPIFCISFFTKERLDIIVGLTEVRTLSESCPV